MQNVVVLLNEWGPLEVRARAEQPLVLDGLAAHASLVALFSVTGVSVRIMGDDLMHIKHLGSDMYFCASAMDLLIYEVMPVSPHDNLREFTAKLKEYYYLTDYYKFKNSVPRKTYYS